MELQWPLILFTVFVAWSAGLFATQALLAFKGRASQSQVPALATSAALLVIGGIAVFFHLQHWERIFNGFGHITSGITQELIAIVVVAVLMVAYFVLLRRAGSEEAKLPSWLCILSVVASAALVIVMAHSYVMASRPAWNSLLWICAVLGNACILGPATMALFAALKGESDEFCASLVFGGSVVNAVCSAAYLVFLSTIGGLFVQVEHYFDLTHPMKELQSFTSPFANESAAVLWLGVVAVGLLVPIVSAVLGKKKSDWKTWGAIAVAAAFVGAICLRVVFYQTGMSVFMFY
ncbi:MAG: dimethyl sulfoxide reductase anchor subunit [Eggerthellaceae bacterium]|nr:dimethyl sulfoxide reductase anchor subunit [Eggerthellaceae bacterium]